MFSCRDQLLRLCTVVEKALKARVHSCKIRIMAGTFGHSLHASLRFLVPGGKSLFKRERGIKLFGDIEVIVGNFPYACTRANGFRFQRVVNSDAEVSAGHIELSGHMVPRISTSSI